MVEGEINILFYSILDSTNELTTLEKFLKVLKYIFVNRNPMSFHEKKTFGKIFFAGKFLAYNLNFIFACEW